MSSFLSFDTKVSFSGDSRTIGHRRGNPSDGRRCAFSSYQTLRATLAEFCYFIYAGLHITQHVQIYIIIILFKTHQINHLYFSVFIQGSRDNI